MVFEVKELAGARMPSTTKDSGEGDYRCHQAQQESSRAQQRAQEADIQRFMADAERQYQPSARAWIHSLTAVGRALFADSQARGKFEEAEKLCGTQKKR